MPIRFTTSPAVLAGLAAILFAAAAGAYQSHSAVVDVAELWQEPVDLQSRDLGGGPGGTALAPDPNDTFQFVAHKKGGTSPGYDVRDSQGRMWSVKMGVEAQSEVAASRILWAIGFHQPPTYYLERWTLSGETGGVKDEGRFRTDPAGVEVGNEWSWYENPFVETQPFRGLVVAQLILNNWDLKTSNNRIYESSAAGSVPSKYIVRDLGASLGKARQFKLFKLLRIRDRQGSKNDLEDFEEQGFIERVEGESVEFDYRGLDSSLIEIVTPADVVWTCELLARLSDEQWDAAFSAAGYDPDERARYVGKIKEKVARGLALASSP